jgi:dTDP-4-amino-4,6-dideoxygalactose transaminase
MLTYSAVPRLKDLASLISPPAAETNLSGVWQKAGDKAFWFSKSAWALATICRAWILKNSGKVPELWIPAYFCNQSLWPARQTGANIRFYPVTAEAEPDWNLIQTMCQSSKPDLFLLTHFFGHQSLPQPARRFCDLMGCLLIEDGAHVLRPFDQVGEHADMTFYSLHKLLPIPDGSLLIVRPRADAYQTFLEQAQSQIGAGFASPWRWLGKRWVQKVLPISLGRQREKKNPVRFDDNSNSDEMPALPAPSPISKTLLQAQLPDLPKIAKARQNNEKSYREIFQNSNDLKAWPAGRVHPDRVPYNAVFQCPSPAIAQKYFEFYRSRGLIVQTWPDLAPEVLQDPQGFAAALWLRSTLLVFPVHQSFSTSNIALYHPRHSTNENP